MNNNNSFISAIIFTADPLATLFESSTDCAVATTKYSATVQLTARAGQHKQEGHVMTSISTTHGTDMILPTKPNHIYSIPAQAAELVPGKESAHAIIQTLNRLYAGAAYPRVRTGRREDSGPRRN